jgi:diguanylate cyclase (GGDEF)-like protein/PAS domain S-box-containing protein
LPTDRQDEIGNLAKSFQQMAEQLKLSFLALENHNAQLRESEHKLIQFLEAMPVGVFVFDANGCPYYANRLAQQLIGKGVVLEVTPEHLPEIYQAYQAGTPHLYPSHRLPGVRALWGESTQVDDIEIHHPDKIIPLEVRGTPIFDELGQVIYAIVAFQDITDRKQAQASQIRFTQELAELNRQLEEYSKTLENKVLERTAALEKANQELHELARSDGLTQIANRRHFDEVLQLEWNILRREQRPLSLILCDVDYFKRYNDTYGHPAGDDCLRQVAQALRQSVRRPADLVARYGGEEFAVILPNTSAEGAVHIATEIQKKIQQLHLPHAQSVVSHSVTLSFGIGSLVPQPPASPETLIKLADHALYEAKKQGRNQIILKN